ncbi:hypothetical protein AB0J55_04275 [Amycolatopsis sp. NPDC049688]|uniref:hypothetical protein n=1 Tax=Amycolatopsis sp. NPDC049688 TaxID=3154733 RepID=UPI003435717E
MTIVRAQRHNLPMASGEPDRRDRTLNSLSGSAHGPVVQAGHIQGDFHFHPPAPAADSSADHGRGTGNSETALAIGENGAGPAALVLLTASALLVLFAITGWAMLVFTAGHHRPLLGPALASGLPLGAVYAGAGAAGVLVFLCGGAMSTGRRAHWRQWIIVVLVLAGLTFGAVKALGGSPLSAVNPFTATRGSAGEPIPSETNSAAPNDKAVADHVVTITSDPVYGMVFEPGSVDVTTGDTVTFHNRTRTACNFQSSIGELPLDHDRSPTVPAGKDLVLTWPGKGLWAFHCRGGDSREMTVGAH